MWGRATVRRAADMNPTQPLLPRNPWPVAIVVFFACFILASVGFVVYSTFHGVDLVSADYYEQEIRYQEQMERVARTQAIRAEVRVSYDPTQQRITLTLPSDHAGRQPTGQIHLYRPSSAQLDRHVDLDVNALGHQALDARALATGLWRVRVSWTVGQTQYYCDQSVVITNHAS